MRPLNDWVLVELEQEQTRVQDSGLILPGEDPVRFARVLKVGPGRCSQRTGKREPTEVKPGERICYFVAALQTKQGQAIVHNLPDGQGLIKESDVLFIVPEGKIKITR